MMKTKSELPSITSRTTLHARKDDFAKMEIKRANTKGNVLYLHPLMHTAKFNLIDRVTDDNNKVCKSYAGDEHVLERSEDTKVLTTLPSKVKSSCPMIPKSSISHSNVNHLPIEHNRADELTEGEQLGYWSVVYTNDKEVEVARSKIWLNGELLQLLQVCRQVLCNDFTKKVDAPISSTQSYISRLFYQTLLEEITNNAARWNLSIDYIMYLDEEFNTYVLLTPKSAIHAWSGKFIVHVQSNICDSNEENELLSIDKQRDVLSRAAENARKDAVNDVIRLSELLREKHNISDEEHNIAAMLKNIVAKQEKERALAEQHVMEFKENNKRFACGQAENDKRRDTMNGIYIPNFEHASPDKATIKTSDKCEHQEETMFNANKEQPVFITPLDLKRFARQQERELFSKLNDLNTEEHINRDLLEKDEHTSFITLAQCACDEEQLLRDVFDEERLQRIYVNSEQRVEFIALGIDAKNDKEIRGIADELQLARHPANNESLLLLALPKERQELAVVGQVRESSLHNSQRSLSTVSASSREEEDRRTIELDEHEKDDKEEENALYREEEIQNELNENNVILGNNQDDVNRIENADETNEIDEAVCNAEEGEEALNSSKMSDLVNTEHDENCIANTSHKEEELQNLSTTIPESSECMTDVGNEKDDADAPQDDVQQVKNNHINLNEEPQNINENVNESNEVNVEDTAFADSLYTLMKDGEEQDNNNNHDHDNYIGNVISSSNVESDEIVATKNDNIKSNTTTPPVVDDDSNHENRLESNNSNIIEQPELQQYESWYDRSSPANSSNVVEFDTLESRPSTMQSTRDSSVDTHLSSVPHFHEFTTTDSLTPEQERTLHTITTVTITLQVAEAKKLYKKRLLNDDNNNTNNSEEVTIQQLHDAVCKAVLEDVKECLANRVARVKIQGKRKRKQRKANSAVRKTHSSTTASTSSSLRNKRRKNAREHDEIIAKNNYSNENDEKDVDGNGAESVHTTMTSSVCEEHSNSEKVEENETNVTSKNNEEDQESSEQQEDGDNTEDMKEVINLLVQHDGIMSDDEMRALIASYTFPRLLHLYQSIEEDIKLANADEQSHAVNVNEPDDEKKIHDAESGNINNVWNNDEKQELTEMQIIDKSTHSINDKNENNANTNTIVNAVAIPLREWQALSSELVLLSQNNNVNSEMSINKSTKNVCKEFIDFSSFNRTLAAQEFYKLHCLELARHDTTYATNGGYINRLVEKVSVDHLCVFLHGNEWDIVIKYAAHFLREQFINEVASILCLHPECIRNVVLQTGTYSEALMQHVTIAQSDVNYNICVISKTCNIFANSDYAASVEAEGKRLYAAHNKKSNYLLREEELEGEPKGGEEVEGLFIHCDVIFTNSDKLSSIQNTSSNNNKKEIHDAYAIMMHIIQSHSFALLYELYTIRHELEEVNVDAEVESEIALYAFDAELCKETLTPTSFICNNKSIKTETNSNDVEDTCEPTTLVLPPRPPSGRATALVYNRPSTMPSSTESNNTIKTNNSNTSFNSAAISTDVSASHHETGTTSDSQQTSLNLSKLTKESSNMNCNKRQSLLELLTQRINSRRSSDASSSAQVNELPYEL